MDTPLEYHPPLHPGINLDFILLTSCFCSAAEFVLLFCDPVDNCSSPSPSIHGILQARIMEWVAISFSRGSPRSRDQAHVFYTGREILYY